MSTPDGLSKQEPTLVVHFVAWLLVNVGAVVVGRTHLLNSQEWSALSSTLTPFVTGAVFAALAVVHRRVVSPAWKAVVTAGADIGVSIPPNLADDWMASVGLAPAGPEPVANPAPDAGPPAPPAA